MSFHDAIITKRWLASRQHSLSNISMDGWKGGKLHVSPNEYDVFLSNYAAGLDRGEKLYMIELRTSPFFKWHADLDMMMKDHINIDVIIEYVKVIQAVIKDYLGIEGKNKLKLLALATEPMHKNDGIKHGLHIIAPNITVTVEDCIEIQKRCVENLKQRDIPINGWEDAFDTSVYKGSGLRMLGSRKIEVCKCKEKEGCELCKKTHKIDVGRQYEVSFVLNGNGEIDERETETLKKRSNLAVKMSSIKSFAQLQSNVPTRSTSIQPIKRRKYTREEVPDELDIVGLLEYHLHISFGTIELVNMIKTANGVVFSVRGCKFCMNVDREHSNSNIYIFLGKNGELSQRCHCPKYSCKSFTSPTISVSSSLMKKCGLITSSGLPPGFSK